MTKKDLLKKLKDVSDDTEIVVHSSNFEKNYALVPLTNVSKYNAKKEKRVFVDGFDGESYKGEAYNIANGDIKIVVLS